MAIEKENASALDEAKAAEAKLAKKAKAAEAKKKAKASKPDKASKPGVFKRIARYFKDLKGEVKKVVWPTKEQVKNNTIVVLVTCAVAAIFVCCLDFIFSTLVQLLVEHKVNFF